MKILSTFLMILFLSLPRVAFAEVPATIELKHEGHSGYWFAEETATEMLKDLKELSLLREKLQLLDVKLELKNEHLNLLREEVKITDTISKKWKVAFSEQLEITRICEAEKNVWYRNPALWGGVGFVVGVGVTVGIGYALAGAK